MQLVFFLDLFLLIVVNFNFLLALDFFRYGLITITCSILKCHFVSQVEFTFQVASYQMFAPITNIISQITKSFHFNLKVHCLCHFTGNSHYKLTMGDHG